MIRFASFEYTNQKTHLAARFAYLENGFTARCRRRVANGKSALAVYFRVLRVCCMGIYLFAIFALLSRVQLFIGVRWSCDICYRLATAVYLPHLLTAGPCHRSRAERLQCSNQSYKVYFCSIYFVICFNSHWNDRNLESLETCWYQMKACLSVSLSNWIHRIFRLFSAVLQCYSKLQLHWHKYYLAKLSWLANQVLKMIPNQSPVAEWLLMCCESSLH